MQRFRNKRLNDRRFNSGPVTCTPAEPSLCEATAQGELDRLLLQLPLTGLVPGEGRGIVICAGGPAYFLCAWVCINMLRWLGCQLPIELWHLDEAGLNAAMRRLIEPLAVSCVNASEMPCHRDVRRLFGRELKAFALLHSRFSEVLLLDADNVPIVDPTFLFDTPQFCDTGAVFWPDITRLPLTAPLWQLSGVSARLEPEFETGQILLHRKRCFSAMTVTMWFNEHSDFWYRYTCNEKETFHMAWRRLNQPYVMPSHSVYALPATMCQHDFDGRRIFQHRRNAKWMIRHNRTLRGFKFESECIRFIEQLNPWWDEISGIHIYHPVQRTSAVMDTARQLCSQQWLYRRVGYDERGMSFRPDGTVGEGTAALERFWDIKELWEPHRLVLDIQSQESRTCRLMLGLDGVWEGRWDDHERMPVELAPISASNSASPRGHIHQAQRLIRDFFGPRFTGYFIHCGSLPSVMLHLAEALLLHEWSGLFITHDSHVSFSLRERYAATDGIDFLVMNDDHDGKKTPATRMNISSHAQLSHAEYLNSLPACDWIARRTASHGDNISPASALAAYTSGKDRCVVLTDCNPKHVNLIQTVIQGGMRPPLIFWQRDSDAFAVHALEAVLVASEYIQIYRNADICGWASLPRTALYQKSSTLPAEQPEVHRIIESSQL